MVLVHNLFKLINSITVLIALMFGDHFVGASVDASGQSPQSGYSLQSSNTSDRIFPNEEFALCAVVTALNIGLTVADFKCNLNVVQSGNTSSIFSVNPCTLHGIACKSRHISSISWSADMLIYGTISPAISQLSYLETLSISHAAYVYGPIPVNIFNLTKLLTLDLSHNHLSGTLSPKIGQLTALSYADLGFNNLHGNLPATIRKLIFLSYTQDTFHSC